MNSKDIIRKVLRDSAINTGKAFLAVHELGIKEYSENNLATRLSEMARAGEVVKRYRFGSRFKEWALAEFAPGPYQIGPLAVVK